MQSFGWRAVFLVFLFSHAFVIFSQMFKIIMILPKLNIYSLQKKQTECTYFKFMDPICCHYHDLFSSTIFFLSYRIKTIKNKHFKPSSFSFFTYKYLLKIIYSSMHLKWSVSCSTDWIDFFCVTRIKKFYTQFKDRRGKKTLST